MHLNQGFFHGVIVKKKSQKYRRKFPTCFCYRREFLPVLKLWDITILSPEKADGHCRLHQICPRHRLDYYSSSLAASLSKACFPVSFLDRPFRLTAVIRSRSFIRWLSPLMIIKLQWCTKRSRMAVASTGSKRMVPHSLNYLLEVMMVDSTMYLMEITSYRPSMFVCPNFLSPKSSMISKSGETYYSVYAGRSCLHGTYTILYRALKGAFYVSQN